MTRILSLSLTLALSLGLAGCDLIGDLLEFGLWVTLILLVLVVALVVWLFKRIF